MLNLIRTCQNLNQQYEFPQYEWKKFIDLGQEGIKQDHKQLQSLSNGRRLFFLRPKDQEMYKKVSSVVKNQ